MGAFVAFVRGKKMSILNLILFLCVPFSASGYFFKSNLTDFSGCKVHYSRFESRYKVFHRFDEQLQQDRDKSLYVDFHFSVLAISDANILLSPSYNIKSSSDKVYEIVIGAGGNTFSDIRKKQKAFVVATLRRSRLLSAVDVRSFWIHVYKDGIIDVGIDGEELAFLTWKDPELLPIRYFSFSTTDDVEAKWFFDCPRRNQGNSTEVKIPETETQKLRRLLLKDYDIYSRPTYNFNTKTKVEIEFLSNFVSLDEKNAIFNMKGLANVSWTDEKLKWIPENYGNITEIVVQQREIWMPNLAISNAIDLEKREPFNAPLLRVKYSGQVIWNPNNDIFTFCQIDGMENWPIDEHTCTINLEFSMTYAADLLLEYGLGSKNIESVGGHNFNTEWNLIEIITETKLVNENTTDLFDKTPPLKLKIVIKRTSSKLNVLLGPFYVICTMMLLNFWTSPFGYIKFTLSVAQFFINCITLLGLSEQIPAYTENVPIIVQLYTGLLLTNVICLIITTMVLNLSRNTKQFLPPRWILLIIHSKFIERLFLLPSFELPSLYGKLNSSLSLQQLSVQESWVRLGTFIDRISWITLTVFIATVLGQNNSLFFQ